MSKYIDADKLIANLERQNVDKKVIEPLIRIIDSLRQEQKEVNLEKEIALWVSENENIHHGDKLMVWLLKEVARYFYGLRQLNSK